MVKAGECVANRREGRCVQPLDVVDREADRTVVGEQPQRSQESGGHGAVIGADLRLPKQERGLECPLLHRRQLGQDISGCITEEIGQPRERESSFGLRGSSGHDSIATVRGRLDAGQPQGRLADPGLARQHGGARKLLASIEEADDRSELLLPADKVPGRDGHAVHILRRWISAGSPRDASS